MTVGVFITGATGLDPSSRIEIASVTSRLWDEDLSRLRDVTFPAESKA